MDASGFVESIMRVMTNTVPMGTNTTGVQLLQTEAGTIQASRAAYLPDTFAGVAPLDSAEVNDCSVACRRLFGRLAASGGMAGVLLLGFADFDRFWRTGVAAITATPQQVQDELAYEDESCSTAMAVARHVPDFWAQQVAGAISAFSSADHWEALDSSRGASGCSDLYRQVLQYLCVCFAPHLIAKHEESQKGILLSIGTAQLSGVDLDGPLAKQLDAQAQRLVQRVLKQWRSDGSLKASADNVLTGVGGEPFVLHPMEAVESIALQLFRSYSGFSYILRCSHGMSKRLSQVSIKANSALEMYAGWTVWERMVNKLVELRACVRSMRDTVASEALHQVHLFLQTALNLHPPLTDRNDQLNLTRALTLADVFTEYTDRTDTRRLTEMKVDFQKLRYFDGDRKAYLAEHPDGFFCVAECVTKKNASDSHYLEAAIWDTIGGHDAEEMDIHLRHDQRQEDWPLRNARFVQFHGYRVQGDIFLVKENLREGGVGSAVAGRAVARMFCCL